MKRYNILLIPLVTIIFSSCVTVVRPVNSIKKLIDKYPNIISIEERWGYGNNDYNWREIGFYSSVSLDIKMENEKRLFVSLVRSSSLKAPFYIDLIGKSTFEIAQYSGNQYNRWKGIPIDFIAKNIDIQLNSVDDVIKNYDLIFSFIDSLTKIEDMDDIELKNQIISGLEYAYYIARYGWVKYIQPIITDEGEWYILNITQDEVPNAHKFMNIVNMKETERGYIHYRTCNGR